MRLSFFEAVVDKLHKAFLLMLSATSPGEIVAARDAMVRLAKIEKYDVHQLASSLILNRKPNGSAPPDPDEGSTREMATFCWYGRDCAHLSEKERKFIEDMMSWRKPSEKQIDWLKSIYARVKRAANV